MLCVGYRETTVQRATQLTGLHEAAATKLLSEHGWRVSNLAQAAYDASVNCSITSHTSSSGQYAPSGTASDYNHLTTGDTVEHLLCSQPHTETTDKSTGNMEPVPHGSVAVPDAADQPSFVAAVDSGSYHVVPQELLAGKRPSKATSSAAQQQNCLVCMEPVRAAQRSVQLPCGHYTCKECWKVCWIILTSREVMHLCHSFKLVVFVIQHLSEVAMQDGTLPSINCRITHCRLPCCLVLGLIVPV